mgnify:CR=1 FL=1
MLNTGYLKEHIRAFFLDEENYFFRSIKLT